MDSVDVPTPKVVEEVVQVAFFSFERIMEHIVLEVSQECDQRPIAAQKADIAVLSVMEELVIWYTSRTSGARSRTNRDAERG